MVKVMKIIIPMSVAFFMVIQSSYSGMTQGSKVEKEIFKQGIVNVQVVFPSKYNIGSRALGLASEDVCMVVYEMAKKYMVAKKVVISIFIDSFGLNDKYGYPVKEPLLRMGNIVVGGWELSEARKYAEDSYFCREPSPFGGLTYRFRDRVSKLKYAHLLGGD